MLNFYNFLEASSWQMNFQDPATPIAGRIIEIHHHIFFFLTIILIFVCWMIFRILNSFWSIFPEQKHNLSTNELNLLTGLSRLKLTHNATIEVIWTLIPSFILILIAIPSFGLLYAMDDIIDPEVTIKTVGHQWYWSYEYADVKKTNNDGILSTFYYKFDSYLVKETDLFLGGFRLLEVDNNIIVPIFSTIRLLITSIDVIHSWTIPSLGIKMDAIPGRLNEISTFILRCSTFYGQCSELCGINHSFMPIGLESVEIDNYFEFIEQKFKKVLNTI